MLVNLEFTADIVPGKNQSLLMSFIICRGGRGGGGDKGFGVGVQFSKRLDFGGSILKMHKM